MTRDNMKKEIKLKFKTYYKFAFMFEDDEGNVYQNVDQNGDDTYRFYFTADDVNMKYDGEKYYIDGLEFELLSSAPSDKPSN